MMRGLLVCLLFLPTAAGAAIRPVYGGEVRIVAPPERWQRLVTEATQCTVTDLLAEPPHLSRDRSEVLLRLADNLVFHDSTPIRAEDVAASIRRWPETPLARGALWRLVPFGRLPGGGRTPPVRVLGPLTLALRVRLPTVDVAWLLDDPRLAVTRDGRGRVGCGPFVPASSDENPRVLRAFDRFATGRPFLDRIVVTRLDTARPAAVPAGSDWDLDLGRSSTTAEDRVCVGPYADTYLVVHSSERLRAAIEARLDPVFLQRVLVGPEGRMLPRRAAPSPPPSLSEAAGTAALRVAYDPQDPLHRPLAERIQLKLHAAGVEVRLEPEADPLAASAPLALVTLSAMPEAAGWSLVALASALGFGTEAERLAADLARAAEDPEAREAAFGEALERIPVVPFFRRPGCLRVRGTVEGVRAGRQSTVDPAWLWNRPPLD